MAGMFRRCLTGSWALMMGLVSLSAGLGGCGAGNPHPVGSYDRGVFFAEQGKDTEAVAALESFIRSHPTDSLTAEAQYLKGMSYMEMEEYPLAAVEFQILRKDYPISDRVEDALYQEGVAYLSQVGRIERDITGAYEARLHFLKFSRDFPNSVHMPLVVEHMARISDLMVRKRLEQVKVYRQLRRHEAVAILLDGILADEAGSTLIPQVLWERAKTAKTLKDPTTAARMHQRLVAEFPDTRFGRRAAKALEGRDDMESIEDGD